MKISVIIPTYKPDSYIWQCLDSLALQTLQHGSFEVVVVVNGCKEPFLSTIKQYVTTHLSDIHTQIIQSDIVGVSNARNLGLETAEGEFIAFLDDDDWISPQYLEQLLAACIRPMSMAVANVLNVQEDSLETSVDWLTNAYRKNKGREQITLLSARSFFSTACCKLIPRHVIGNQRFNTSFKQGEDSLFMASISKNIQDIRLASEDTIYYRRIRRKSASRNRNRTEIIADSLKLSAAFIKMYLQDIKHHNSLFFVTRALGPFKGIFKARI